MRLRHSAVAADDRCTHRERRNLAAVFDAGDEGLKGRHGLQRFGLVDVVLDHDVNEAHAVVEPKNLVGEALRLVLVQLRKHCLDQLLVLTGPRLVVQLS